MRRWLLLLTLVGALGAQVVWKRRPAPVAAGGGASEAKEFVSISGSGDSNTIIDCTPVAIDAGDLVVGLCAATPASGNTPTMACDGQAMTNPANGSTYDSGNGWLAAAYYLTGAAADASATCTCTWTSAVAYRTCIVGTWGGVDASGFQAAECSDPACNSLVSTAATRTTETIGVTGPSLLVALGHDWDGGVTITGLDGWTVRLDTVTPWLLDKDVDGGTHPATPFASASPSDEYFGFLMGFTLQ